jgi:hypothetical protein
MTRFVKTNFVKSTVNDRTFLSMLMILIERYYLITWQKPGCCIQHVGETVHYKNVLMNIFTGFRYLKKNQKYHLSTYKKTQTLHQISKGAALIDSRTKRLRNAILRQFAISSKNYELSSIKKFQSTCPLGQHRGKRKHLTNCIYIFIFKE